MTGILRQEIIAVFMFRLILLPSVVIISSAKLIPDPSGLDDVDYCQTEFKCGGKEHYACTHSLQASFSVTDQAAGHVKKCTAQTGISSVDRGSIEEKVNNFRNSVADGQVGFTFGGSNIRQVTWDYTLEHFAQILGTNDFGLLGSAPYPTFQVCAKTKEKGGTASLSKTGAFLFEDTTPPIEKPDIDELMETFAVIKPEESLITTFAYPDPVVPGSVQLKYVWTMLSWAEATKIGCTYVNSTCEDTGQPDSVSLYLLCFIGSGVNTPGEAVFLKGQACTNCPAETKCKKESLYWPKLCAPIYSPNLTTTIHQDSSVILHFLLLILIMVQHDFS